MTDQTSMNNHDELACEKCAASILHLYTDDTDTFIAKCEYQIPTLWKKFYGEEYPFDNHLDTETLSEAWFELDDGFLFRMDVSELGDGSPKIEAKTCAEWAVERGEGWLCSTEY